VVLINIRNFLYDFNKLLFDTRELIPDHGNENPYNFSKIVKW